MQNTIYTHAEYRNCIEIADLAKLNRFIDRHGKVAKKPGTLLGRNLVFTAFKKIGILDKDNMPYQQYLKHFKLMPKVFQKGEMKFEKYIPLVIPESIEFLSSKIEEYLKNG